MSDRLTQAQRRVLNQLQDEQWRNARQLNASLKTLEALRKRGLVRSRSLTVLGYQLNPAANVDWQITGHGQSSIEVKEVNDGR